MCKDLFQKHLVIAISYFNIISSLVIATCIYYFDLANCSFHSPSRKVVRRILLNIRQGPYMLQEGIARPFW